MTHESRSKAWYTRRVKYGPKGHSKGAYSQPYMKLERLALKMIVKLHNDGVLSEGQCAKGLEMDRIHFRAMCDFMGSD